MRSQAADIVGRKVSEEVSFQIRANHHQKENQPTANMKPAQPIQRPAEIGKLTGRKKSQAKL